MSFFFISIVITNFFYLILGKIIVNKFLEQNVKNSSECAILGIIFASFISLLINFFFPLNIIVNTITYFLIFLYFLLKRIQINKKDFFFIIISTSISFGLILFDTEYRPDAGLYHIPYVQILNESKIIIGLSNLHFRFGHISIMQYLSAFNYNIITNLNSIIIPLASLISFIYIYFFRDLLKFIKRKEATSIGKLFSLIILVYLSYKINRYSEFGNDAPAHLFSFYLISKFIYLENNSLKNIKLIYIFSVFAFLNKVFLIFVFLLPLSMFLNDRKNFLKILFSFPTLFLFLWLTKNILISGCIIYPIKNTCFTNLKWTNIDDIEKVQIESEAWAKGWPQNKNSEINIRKFKKNFNWVEAWSSVHLKYIIKILSPFILIIFTLFIFLNLKVKSINNEDKRIHLNFTNQKIIILLIMSLIGVVSFFLQSPIYRYGYSYIILFLFLFFLSLFSKINENNFLKISKVIFIICFVVLTTKQAIRVQDKYNERTFVPSYIFIDQEELDNKYKKVKLSDDFNVYFSNTECFYGRAPCSHYKENIINIRADKRKTFHILYN